MTKVPQVIPRNWTNNLLLKPPVQGKFLSNLPETHSAYSQVKNSSKVARRRIQGENPEGSKKLATNINTDISVAKNKENKNLSLRLLSIAVSLAFKHFTIIHFLFKTSNEGNQTLINFNWFEIFGFSVNIFFCICITCKTQNFCKPQEVGNSEQGISKKPGL